MRRGFALLENFIRTDVLLSVHYDIIEPEL
jgi:hypothetical protein